jgi:hypothetical protein
MSTLPSTEQEIADFVAQFEAGTLPKERWTHGAHLLTGAWYVHTLGVEAATARMRERVKAYNLAVGGMNTETAGYHETLTVFWIKRLALFRQQQGDPARVAFCAAAVREFEGRRGILREFYGFDVIASREARLAWIAPDLEELS